MQVRRRKLVVVIVATVVLIVVLSAVLYVMTLGYGSGPGPGTVPKVSCDISPVSGGAGITIRSTTYSKLVWDDVEVLISDGENLSCWRPIAADLDGGKTVTVNYSSKPLGELSVTLSIRDSSGNGRIDEGDYLEITSEPLQTHIWAIALRHEPSGGTMWTSTWYVDGP